MTDYFLGLGQRAPGCLIKSTFLGEAEAAPTRSGIRSRFGNRGVSTSEAVLGLGFSVPHSIYCLGANL